jgi:peptidoglycan/LPS O-acetylase OafA/YrhL
MRRIADLDGLRGAAAVLIVVYHVFQPYLPGCWMAVDVFFVLSGYLITGIVLQHTMSWQFLKSFYIRRGLRIWPIYYLLILLLILAGLYDLKALPYYLTYTQQVPRYWDGEMPAWKLMEHAWTLALEEQFYLIWPVLVLLAGKRRIGYLALAIAVISVEARYAQFHWWNLLGRCDGFALGGFLAVIMADTDTDRARHRARSWAMVFAILAMLQAAPLIATGHLVAGVGPASMAARATLASFLAYIPVALVASHAGHPMLVLLRTAPMVYLGTISYGIYLYHLPIVKSSETLSRYLRVAPGPALSVIEFLMVLIVAIASWHLIERPILRLKDRVPYRRNDIAAEKEGSSSPAFPLVEVLSPSAV